MVEVVAEIFMTSIKEGAEWRKARAKERREEKMRRDGDSVGAATARSDGSGRRELGLRCCC